MLADNKIKVACIIGTRPEVIKMAPVIHQLRKYDNFHVDIICTAQHRQLLDDMMNIFSLKADVDLNIMQENQTLAELTGHLFLKLEPIISKSKYDVVLAQGDTTTTLVSSEVAFYHKILFGHVEAGLRSYDMWHPFPEEMDRVFVSKIATWHFTPTSQEEDHLLKEGINKDCIYVTGNTVIDALKYFSEKDIPLPFSLDPNKRIILITLHRRESFGEQVKGIFEAFVTLSQKFPDIEIVYPVHPNPNINRIAHDMLNDLKNVKLINPLPYDQFISLLKKSFFVMTDSGGIQEEAPALNKPVLILRDVTERPLIVEYGLAELVGTNKDKIIEAASNLLTNESKYKSMQKGMSPYGDGHAAERIVEILQQHFARIHK